MVTTNMSDIKNMFIYQWLQQTAGNDAYWNDKLSVDTNLASQTTNVLDTNKQAYTVEAKDWTITINVTKNSANPNTAKEWTITITKDNNGKLSVTRTDKPAETQKTQTPT
jgi:hypothetical protein